MSIEYARVNELYEATMEADKLAGEVTDMEPLSDEQVRRGSARRGPRPITRH